LETPPLLLLLLLLLPPRLPPPPATVLLRLVRQASQQVSQRPVWPRQQMLTLLQKWAPTAQLKTKTAQKHTTTVLQTVI
jgi:hypothetical protein